MKSSTHPGPVLCWVVSSLLLYSRAHRILLSPSLYHWARPPLTVPHKTTGGCLTRAVMVWGIDLCTVKLIPSYSVACAASVSNSKPHTDWSSLAISCPLMDATTRGDAGYILLRGSRAKSGASLKWGKSAMRIRRRNGCHPRQRSFSKSEPCAGSDLVTVCSVDSFDELIKLLRGHLRCYTNQERLRIHVCEKSEAGIYV